MTDDGRFIEIQGTAEQTPFSSEHLSSLDIGTKGFKRLLIQLSNLNGFCLFIFSLLICICH